MTAMIGLVLAGQSNGFAGYAEDRVDQLRSHPNLWQFKQDRTFQQAPLMPLDHQSLGNPNRVFVSYTYYMVRDHLIPRFPGVNFCILPQSVGGSGFSNSWHAPNAALTAATGITSGIYPAGGPHYETTVAQMNAFLAADAGNTIGCFILQNGEQETGDQGVDIGYYHASFGLTNKAAYNRYVDEMLADMAARVTGGRTWPFLIGQMPPDLVYPQSLIGPSSDGLDHNGSQYIPFFEAQQEMPGRVSNCAYIDSLYPTKVMAHSGVMTDGNDNYHQDGTDNPIAGGDGLPDVIMNSGNYWLHTCQAGHRVMAHRAFKQYMRLKGHGTVITATYGIAPSSVVTLEVPTLAIASSSNDNRPDFDVGIPASSLAGDVIKIQSNSGSGYVDYVSYTLTSGDFTTANISKTGVTALTDGNYIFQARMERGASTSAYSSSVTGLIDTALPVLSSATGSPASNTTATMSVSTNKSGGVLYWVVTASATKPTAAQVKAGQNNTGVAALASGSKTVLATGVQTAIATELTTAGARYAHFMQEDSSANQSVVAASASWTQVGGVWTPADLSPALWIDVSDASTRFQNVAGTTAATANGNPVGCLNDKSGNAFHLTATADDATRPTLQGIGAFPYIDFDGTANSSATSSKLRRVANLGLYNNGSCTLFVAARGNASTGRYFVGEFGTTPIIGHMVANQVVATQLSVFYRDDTGGTNVIAQQDITEANAWDNTDNVVGITDTGTLITSYMDGVSTDSKTYSRGVTVFTPTRFAIGCDFRTTGGSFFTGRLYALVAVKRVLTDAERVHLITYLAATMGRVL